MRLIRQSLFLAGLFIAAIAINGPAFAFSTIRDAEIETCIRQLATPIFKAAGLVPENVSIIIVNDPQINAFVAGGMNVFINTGLMMDFENPEVLQGAMAHEVGHISGGHLARNSDVFKNAALGSAISYGLGAVAVALGAPDVGIAVMQGGSHVAQRGMLQYSRENEESADQAALKFLDKTGNPSTGLLELLEHLNKQEYLLYGKQNPYARTHPLSRERILHIRNHHGMKASQGTISAALRADYTRSYVKLHAFFDPVSETLKKFPLTDNSVNARYARAIAYQRVPDLTKSFKELDSLLAEFPKNAFFHELKGQTLFENGRAQEAIGYYQKSVALLPSEPLLKLGLAMAQIGAADAAPAKSAQLLESAISQLSNAHVREPSNLMVLEQLEIAYGKSGKLGMAYLARAEKAILQKNKNDIEKFARLAEKHIPAGSPSAVRAKDILKNLKSL